MKNLWLLCVLAIAVGCSPSQESIQKAVEKGDYQYLENYLSNPKYWNDPTKSAINEAAIEGLILLNRIDTAIVVYENVKGKPREEMVVRAFANALTKSKSKKIPQKLLELINDDRNDASDALLRKTAVEIEPSFSKILFKIYIKRAIESRKKAHPKEILDFVDKAVLWDIKGIFNEPVTALKKQYSGLISFYSHSMDLEQKKEWLSSVKSEASNAAGEMTDCAYKYKDWEYREYEKCVDKKRIVLHEKIKSMGDLQDEIRRIEKTIPEYETKIKAKLPEVEATEDALLSILAREEFTQ